MMKSEEYDNKDLEGNDLVSLLDLLEMCEVLFLDKQVKKDS